MQRCLLIVTGGFRQSLPVLVDDAEIEPGLGELRVIPDGIVKTAGRFLQVAPLPEKSDPQAVMYLGDRSGLMDSAAW